MNKIGVFCMLLGRRKSLEGRFLKKSGGGENWGGKGKSACFIMNNSAIFLHLPGEREKVAEVGLEKSWEWKFSEGIRARRTNGLPRPSFG